ncbi:VQ motif-containing protein 4-like [Impatiens glandulifera]|uniref:VQ motif-containing protein 4-like n=1 Tax=Impatiens glandulifera TaxID=253017 RepID=UPI001FB08885|nr:VQ motif-containing protein 4-like [Impatiens glandulifera]
MERFADFPPSSPARPDEIDNSSTTNSPTSNSNSYNGASLLLLSRPVCRSESNPHPTIFVQADSTTFKQVVQMLTGSVHPPPDPAFKGHNNIPPIRTGQKKQGFKLYERRNSLKYGLTPLLPNLNKKNSEVLSPSMLDFPSLALMSPVTPLTGEKVYSPTSSPEEEKAIAHKEGFYLHPSPGRTSMSIPMNEPPRLLSLFPVTSSSSRSVSHSKT